MIHCPACHNPEPRNLGELGPRKGIFELRDPGAVYRCDLCGLLFRYPYLSRSELVSIYQRLDAQNWNYRHKRTDFHLALKQIVSRYASGNVLDVGCFRGDFLELLPSGYGRFGIEPSASARDIASSKRISILGSTVEDLEAPAVRFSAITLLDVLEHLPDPVETLAKLRDLLLPGGILIISTGNTDALPWRMMRRDYWYYCPEHVTFFNPRWFKRISRQTNLRVLCIQRFSHSSGSIGSVLMQVLSCLVFWGVDQLRDRPRLQDMLCSVYPFSRVRKWRSAPVTDLWADHMLVCLKKGL